MRLLTAASLPLFVCALAACGSDADRQADATEDRIEQQAEASAAASGDAVAALGLTERQLLDADLVTADGTELGDVEQVRRGAGGAVEGLLVEIEDSNPDRYVVVPLTGLTTRVAGADKDLQTKMTAAQIGALPDAQLGAETSTTATGPAN
ncbi:PRC-barrel domain containing protein [Parafrankia sp. BMG5.11]|uniref:PRC-barrel domain containing protein n=1 Tax=Parafrankia sp. BMG5.11 TaxID=222540 RepID=UPI00103926CE|nr:PRC-barrel domain containing protein [Parafrankia sp. BMG5.11]TCJ39768.1 PRC-barrel domain containing protein [Parafrankia sp. BMG5.11]